MAQSSIDNQLQQFAAWATSFLFRHVYSKENTDTNIQSEESASKSISLSFSEDSMVMKLSSWLMNQNLSGVSFVTLFNLMTWSNSRIKIGN